MPEPAGRSLRFALYAGAVLLLVTGCSEEPVKPGTVPTTTSSPSSPSESPSALTPEQEVASTMRAYFDTANAMFKTGDVAALRAFSTSGCPCRKITRSVERVVADGGRYEGTRYDVQSIRVHDIVGETALAEVIAKVAPYKVYAGNGDLIEDSPGGELHTDFSLLKRGDKWIIGNAVNLG